MSNRYLEALEDLPLDDKIQQMIATNERQIAANVAWLKGRGWSDAEIAAGCKAENEIDVMDAALDALRSGEAEPVVSGKAQDEDEAIGEHFSRNPFLY